MAAGTAAGQATGMAVSWLLDELAHAGPEHLDAGFVAGYDRKQGRPDPAADIAVFQACGLDARSTIVDLAAGTGQFALAAARLFGRVIAVDVSVAMLAVLREQATSAIRSRLDIIQAGFLSYQHQRPPADGIYTRNALHQLPDFWKVIALDRMARMLRPGGVLRIHDLIYDFTAEDAPDVFQQWFDRAADDPGTGYTASDYATHIRTEHSTFRWLFEPMLTATGFQIVTSQFRQRLYGSYTCIRC